MKEFSCSCVISYKVADVVESKVVGKLVESLSSFLSFDSSSGFSASGFSVVVFGVPSSSTVVTCALSGGI